MILTSTAESRLLDKIAMTEYGLPEAVLMENAGRAVVSRMREFTDWEGAFTVIVCGTGNNGGDGLSAPAMQEAQAPGSWSSSWGIRPTWESRQRCTGRRLRRWGFLSLR